MPRKRLSKDDLVERIRTGLDTKGWEITKTATRAMLDELAVVARGELVEGNEFAVPGIVLLQTERRSSRQGRNPSTGESITIPERQVIKARAAKNLREVVAAQV